MKEINLYSSINNIVKNCDIVYANKVCTLMKSSTSKTSYYIVKGDLPKKGVIRFEEYLRECELVKGVMFYPTMSFTYSTNPKKVPLEKGEMNIITIDRNSDIRFVDLYNLLTKNRHWAYDDFKKYTFKII